MINQLTAFLATKTECPADLIEIIIGLFMKVLSNGSETNSSDSNLQNDNDLWNVEMGFNFIRFE